MGKNRLLDFALFTRGPIATLAILGLISQFVDFSRFPAVRAVHAVVVSWNDLMADFADAIPINLPFELSAYHLNLFTIWLVLILPASVIWSATTKREQIKSWIQNRKSLLEYIPMPGWVILYFLSFIPLLKEAFFVLAVSAGYVALIWLLQNSPEFAWQFLLWAIAILVLVYFYVIYTVMAGMKRSPPFRHGLIFAATSILAIEVMYFSPVVGEYLDAFADSKLGPD